MDERESGSQIGEEISNVLAINDQSASRAVILFCRRGKNLFRTSTHIFPLLISEHFDRVVERFKLTINDAKPTIDSVHSKTPRTHRRSPSNCMIPLLRE
jgi:hypothetical protein